MKNLKNIFVFVMTAGIILLFLVVPVFSQDAGQGKGDEKQDGKAEYTADRYKDPFKGYFDDEEAVDVSQIDTSKPMPVLPPLEVQGIIWNVPIPQAIINGEIYKIGETIRDFNTTGELGHQGSGGVIADNTIHIVDIDKNGISVFYSGYKFTVSSPGAVLNNTFAVAEPKGGSK